MNMDIVKKWNEIIGPEDTVYHLGDHAFKLHEKAIEIATLTRSLNGKKILILGNHDKEELAKDYGFDSVVHKDYVTIGAVKFKLNHYPYERSRTAYDVARRPDAFTNAEYDPATKEIYPLICGHVHDVWTVKHRCLNVGWDIWETPISEETVSKIYSDTSGFRVYIPGKVDENERI